ncbi:MAG: dihydrolipoyl dehydrogenase [Nitrososphaerota archaeon]
MEFFDAVVIGAGPGGYSSAIRLSHKGFRTAIIEKNLIGGECLNFGCIPSKILIENVNMFFKLSKSNLIKPSLFNWMELQSKKNKLVEKVRSGVEYLLRGNNVKIFNGFGKLTKDLNVEVYEKDGGRRKLSTKYIIIATGSTSRNLPSISYDGLRVLTPREILDLDRIPKSLLIVGGGAIGLEIGTMFAKLGVDVTVVEIMDQLLPGFDLDIAKLIEKKLKELGVKIYLKSSIKSSEVSAEKVKAQIETPNEEINVEVEYALISIGKVPNTSGIGLEEVGVELTQNKFIKIDSKCRTNIENIYAIGDVTGPPLLAHKAYAQSKIAVENIAGKEVSMDSLNIPIAIFTDPEIAMVGLTRREAEERNYKVKVTRFPYSALGRAVAEEETDGFIRIISSIDTGKILGIQIIGSKASELMGEASLAINSNLTVEDLANTVHPHPTFSEIISEVAEYAISKPVHLLVK